MQRPQLLLSLAALAMASPALAQAASTANSSTSTVVSALILNGVIFAVSIIGFLTLRPRFKKVYSPKTFLGPEDERVPPQEPSMFGWIAPFLRINKMDILSGLDTIPVCTHYDADGQPVFKQMKGWNTTDGATSRDTLPGEAQAYLDLIEEVTECPVVIFSAGPEREKTYGAVNWK